MENTIQQSNSSEFQVYREMVKQELVTRFGYIPESADEIITESADRLAAMFEKGVTYFSATDLL